MKLLFACWGSLGEILPVLRLAASCRENGHAVLLATNPAYRGRAAELGIAFTPLGPRLPTSADPAAIGVSLAARDHGKEIVRRWLDPNVGSQARECEAAIRSLGGCDAIVSSWITPGALIAAETHGIPLLFYHLHPLALMQVADFPILAALRRSSRRAKRTRGEGGRFRAAFARRFERFACGYFALRRGMGLPGYDGTLFEGPPSAAGRLALFSRHLLRTEETNAPTALIGYPPGHGPGRAAMPAAVRSFLDRPGPPVLISFGSALSLRARPLIAACVAAARRLGRRTIVLTQAAKATGLVEEDVLFIRECAPASVLPRCACLIAHAGIGTIGDGLAAGIPMLSIPHYGDQFDNSDRLEWLGIGRTAMPEERNFEGIARELERLLEERGYRQAASLWPDRLAAERSGERSIATIQSMLG